MSLLLVSLHISLRIIWCLNCNKHIVNFIPLKLLFCMSKIICSLHLMMVIVQPVGCFWYYWSQYLNLSLTALVWHFIYSFKFVILLSINRSQTVITSASLFQPVLLEYGVPKGSVLRPLFYSLYTTPLHFIMSKYPGLRCHFFADDTIDVHETWKRGISMDSRGNKNQIA